MKEDNNQSNSNLKKCKNYTCTGILALTTVGVIMGIYYYIISY